MNPLQVKLMMLAHQADCDPERELGGRLTSAPNETSTGLCFSSPLLAEGLNHNPDRENRPSPLTWITRRLVLKQ
jgi:hypothetical protein